MLLSLLFNYFVGIWIAECKSKSSRNIIFITSIVYNVGLLFIFKYLSFTIDNIWNIFSLDNSDKIMFKSTLPLGISFYTFQVLSYVIDVYRGKIYPEKNIISLGTYITMFQQLIAGPIVTYDTISSEIKNRHENPREFFEGFRCFTIGLASKMLLANSFSTIFSDINMRGYDVISSTYAWIGAFAFTLQIYFDFAGYSLMAIGLGLTMGFHLPKNFDYPYSSRSITEFWRRWHITLGTWFREYVYIPLGGNRCGHFRCLFNLLIVWLLTGLWHGAGWNFILWGMFFYILQMIEKKGFKKILDKSIILSKIYMILLIPISWMIFEIENIKELGIYLSRMLPFVPNTVGIYVNQLDFVPVLKTSWPLFLAAILFLTRYPERILNKVKGMVWEYLIIMLLFGASLASIYYSKTNPFLYFRF